MPEINDDPREVLALLNSLGFVGITAHQLKAFMKDLKMYRKVKEHERQQRREEMESKILYKQQNIIEQIRKGNIEENCIRNIVSPDSVINDIDDSLVKVRIKYTSRHEEVRTNGDASFPRNKVETNDFTRAATSERESTSVQRAVEHDTRRLDTVDDKSRPITRQFSDERGSKAIPGIPVKTDDSTSPKKRTFVARVNNMPLTSSEEKKRSTTVVRPTSAPTLRPRISASDTTESISAASAPAVPAARPAVGSRQRSFIRPWQLQPQTRKNNKKSDPVALYHEYQRHWKQIPFPGEARHSGIRWAVRERMLGVDPRPKTLPRKSTSMPVLRRNQ